MLAGGAAMACGAAPALRGQGAPPRPVVVGIAVGPTPHRFSSGATRDGPASSIGTGFIAGLRVSVPVGPVVVIEPSAALYWYLPPTGGQREMFLLDCNVHGELAAFGVRAFGGGGVGTVEPWPSGGIHVSANAAVGARLDIARPWSARVEARWRTIQYLGTSREYTFGIGLRL
jgi:hypothetical protein